MKFWQFSWQGIGHSNLDFTLAECVALDETTGKRWAVDIPLDSPEVTRAWLAAAFRHCHVADPDKTADALTNRDINAAFSIIDDGEEATGPLGSPPSTEPEPSPTST